MHGADERALAAADHAHAQFAFPGFHDVFPYSAFDCSQVQPEHLGGSRRRWIASSAAGEIVEGDVGRLDDVPGDERRAFGRPLLGALDAALPFQDGPAVVARLGQQREDALEIDLAVAQRAEPAGPLRPRLIAAVDADPAARPELGVLHVKAADPLAVELDELAGNRAAAAGSGSGRS